MTRNSQCGTRALHARIPQLRTVLLLGLVRQTMALVDIRRELLARGVCASRFRVHPECLAREAKLAVLGVDAGFHEVRIVERVGREVEDPFKVVQGRRVPVEREVGGGAFIVQQVVRGRLVWVVLAGYPGGCGVENEPIASEYILAASWNWPVESIAFARLISGRRPGGYRPPGSAYTLPESRTTSDESASRRIVE